MCDTASDKLLAEIGKIGHKIRDGSVKSVVVLCGAGISTAAGIPDYRSKDSGMYNRNPASIFTPERFLKNPEEALGMLSSIAAVEEPTATHRMFRQLRDAGLQVRVFTQNVDGLEVRAGLEPGKDVEQFHGTLDRVRCTLCHRRTEAATVDARAAMVAASARWCEEPPCVRAREKMKEKWGDLVQWSEPEDGEEAKDAGIPERAERHINMRKMAFLRPDVVLFGECPRFKGARLTRHLLRQAKTEVASADLLLIMGTSLSVRPFYLLAERDSMAEVYFVNRDLEPCPTGARGLQCDCDLFSKALVIASGI